MAFTFFIPCITGRGTQLTEEAKLGHSHFLYLSFISLFLIFTAIEIDIREEIEDLNNDINVLLDRMTTLQKNSNSAIILKSMNIALVSKAEQIKNLSKISMTIAKVEARKKGNDISFNHIFSTL